MRKTLIILGSLLMAILLVFGACAPAQTPPPSPPPLSEIPAPASEETPALPPPSPAPEPTLTPAPRPASLLYVVDEKCPYYTEDWLFHLEARGFQVDTVMVCNSSVDAELADYDLIVVGYVLNSRVNVPIYTSIANSGLPILNGDQNLVQLFGQGTDTFEGRTTYGEFIHIPSDHPLTKGYSGDVICSQYPMYRNMIEADGTVLATVTTTEKDRPPAPPGESAPPPEPSITADVWSVNGNRIYFGFWPSGQDNAQYWTFFDRSVDYLLTTSAEPPSVEPPVAPTEPPPEIPTPAPAPPP